MKFIKMHLLKVLFLGIVFCSPVFGQVISYDSHSRIIHVDFGAGNSISYTYDRLGNRLSSAVVGLPAQSPYAANAVPIWWLNKHGFTSNLDAITEIDFDGDGWTVAEEWIANTDPTDPNSALRFSEFLVSENGTTIDLSWRAETGRMYRLEQSTNLQSWTPVVGLDNIVGQGEAVNFQLTNLHSDKLFFRIVVWKP